MDLGLKDKVTIVTGGAKGIGAAITRAFAAEGAIVCILGRNPEEASKLIGELSTSPGPVQSLPCELTDEGSIAAAVSAVLATHGRIDCVVNNAGVNDSAGMRSPVSDFRASLERNIVHCFVVVQNCLDALIESRGTIVNIGSKCATTGQGGTSGYAASKGAMNALTREWALELAPHGIRVNCVIPAEVMTPLYEKWIRSKPDPEGALARIRESIPFENRMTTAEEIAQTVAFVASPRSSHTTGQLLYVDGGYVHFDRACTTKPTA